MKVSNRRRNSPARWPTRSSAAAWSAPRPSRRTVKVPALKVATVGGGEWDLAAQSPQNFTMVVVYRGYHCPVCKAYLGKLSGLAKGYADAGFSVLVVSMDGEERATKAKDEWGLDNLAVGYGLDEATAKLNSLSYCAHRLVPTTEIAQRDAKVVETARQTSRELVDQSLAELLVLGDGFFGVVQRLVSTPECPEHHREVVVEAGAFRAVVVCRGLRVEQVARRPFSYVPKRRRGLREGVGKLVCNIDSALVLESLVEHVA